MPNSFLMGGLGLLFAVVVAVGTAIYNNFENNQNHRNQEWEPKRRRDSRRNCGRCNDSVNLTDDEQVNCDSCHTSFHGICARRLERRRNGRVCSTCRSVIETNERCGLCINSVNLTDDRLVNCGSCHTSFHGECARRLERRQNGRVCSTCRSVIETNERCGRCINSVNLTDDRLVNCGICHTSFHGECARRLERRQNGRECLKCYSFINTNEVVRDETNCLICRQSILVGDDNVLDLIRCRSCSQMYHSRCARVGAFNRFRTCVSCGDGMELDE